MIYLLLVAFIFFGLARWLHTQARQAQDDFASDIYAFIADGLGVVLFVVYLAAAFWNHRFW